jgi:hypothetical protein
MLDGIETEVFKFIQNHFYYYMNWLDDLQLCKNQVALYIESRVIHNTIQIWFNSGTKN